MDKIINQDIIQAIDTYSAECQLLIVTSVSNDNLEITPNSKEFFSQNGMDFDIDIPRMSSSAYTFHSILSSFGFDIGVLLSLKIYNKVVSALISFFKCFVQNLVIKLERCTSNLQRLLVLTNIIFVTQHIMPKMREQLKERFEREIPELLDEQKQYNGIPSNTEEIETLKAKIRLEIRENLTKMAFNLTKIDYSSVNVFKLECHDIRKHSSNRKHASACVCNEPARGRNRPNP
jgi:hypothetical protein